MNFIFNLLTVIITGAAVLVFIFNLVLNLIRAIKVNKEIKANPDFVEGKISKIVEQKKKVYIVVDYTSKVNGNVFAQTFELSEKEAKKYNYVQGQDIKIYYSDVKNLKKVNCFPTYLENEKQKIEAGPVFADSMLVIGGSYIFVMALITVLQKIDGCMGLSWSNPRAWIANTKSFDSFTAESTVTPCFSLIYVAFIIIMYAMLVSYIIQRIGGMTVDQKQEYLKLNGLETMAEVKTFKYTKNKNAQGLKEAELKIEFFTSTGDKVACDLSSYLYTQDEKQFIDILYDPKDPKNVVYIASSKSEKKKKKNGEAKQD